MSGRIIRRATVPHKCSGQPFQGTPGDEWACDECGAVWVAMDATAGVATNGRPVVHSVGWWMTARRLVER